MKQKGTSYDKIANAIGKMKSFGIEVSLININESSYSFKPDEKNNRILFGLKAADRIGDDIVKKVIKGRPYAGIKDFMNRAGVDRLPTVSLIKAGAFDELDNEWAEKVCPDEPRKAILFYFLMKNSNFKNKLNLQNLSGLRKYNVGRINDKFLLGLEMKDILKIEKAKAIDDKISLSYEVYNKICELYEKVNNVGFDLNVVNENGMIKIELKDWDKVCENEMNKIRSWIKENEEDLIKEYNSYLFKELVDKYGKGNISKWEMESLCFYYHEHELAKVNKVKYGIIDFNELNQEPIIERTFKAKDGKMIPVYHLDLICGTVIGKNKTRHLITLLTKDGVVNVKLPKDYFANIDRQISIIGNDGKKKIVEKSWITRGNLMLIRGYRRGDQFVGKKRKKEQIVYLIKEIDKNGDLTITSERYDEKG